jgi:hypothetical protein
VGAGLPGVLSEKEWASQDLQKKEESFLEVELMLNTLLHLLSNVFLLTPKQLGNKEHVHL